MKILKVRAGVLVTVAGLLLLGAGVATAQAGQTQNGQYGSETPSPGCTSTCETQTEPATPPPDTCECTETTPSDTTTTPTDTTTTETSTTTTSTPSTDTSTTTTPEVLGTTAATTKSAATPTTTAPVTVLGVKAAVTNPLPVAAAAGQVETGGQLLSAGLAALGAFLSLAGGFLLRRRHGEA
jgi:hypothetical protein